MAVLLERMTNVLKSGQVRNKVILCLPVLKVIYFLSLSRKRDKSNDENIIVNKRGGDESTQSAVQWTIHQSWVDIVWESIKLTDCE